jgi:hypothetical protein
MYVKRLFLDLLSLVMGAMHGTSNDARAKDDTRSEQLPAGFNGSPQHVEPVLPQRSGSRL